METLARSANRGSVSTGGYDIDYSVKNEDANGERFQSGSWFTNYSSTKTFTYSMWVKRTDLTTGTQYLLQYQYNTGVGFNFGFAADSSTQALYYLLQTSGTVYAYGKTTALYRDTSAWYHIVWRVDTTQATAADRIRIYVNGVQQDLESGGGGHPAYPSQNYDAPLQTTQYVLGAGGTNGFCGYCADYYFIDGQSLAPTEFGEFDSATGIWKPIEYTGTFGNEGYHLDFADASALGKDVSSNNHGNFSHYGGSSADQALDTPTNNFCTMNMLSRRNGNIKNQEGGTKVTTDGGSSWCSMNATMGVSSGKWYWEILFENDPGDTNTVMIGIAGSNDRFIPSGLADYYLGNVSTSGSIGWYFVSGGVFNGSGTWTGPNYGDIAMIALDMDNLKLYYGVNGTWGNSSDPETNTNGINIASSFSGRTGATDIILPSVSVYQGKRINSMNFGGYRTFALSSAETDADGWGSFEYAPPSGYYALCTKNLAEYG